MRPIAGKPTAYLCSDFTCKRPANDLKEVAGLLEKTAGRGKRAA